MGTRERREKLEDLKKNRKQKQKDRMNKKRTKKTKLKAIGINIQQNDLKRNKERVATVRRGGGEERG